LLQRFKNYARSANLVQHIQSHDCGWHGDQQGIDRCGNSRSPDAAEIRIDGDDENDNGKDDNFLDAKNRLDEQHRTFQINDDFKENAKNHADNRDHQRRAVLEPRTDKVGDRVAVGNQLPEFGTVNQNSPDNPHV